MTAVDEFWDNVDSVNTSVEALLPWATLSYYESLVEEYRTLVDEHAVSLKLWKTWFYSFFMCACGFMHLIVVTKNKHIYPLDYVLAHVYKKMISTTSGIFKRKNVRLPGLCMFEGLEISVHCIFDKNTTELALRPPQNYEHPRIKTPYWMNKGYTNALLLQNSDQLRKKLRPYVLCTFPWVASIPGLHCICLQSALFGWILDSLVEYVHAIVEDIL